MNHTVLSLFDLKGWTIPYNIQLHESQRGHNFVWQIEQI